jgi:membrane protease YdiL (CAAX protease family)
MFKKLSETTYLQIIFVGLVVLIGTIALMLIGLGISGAIYGFDTTMGVFKGSMNSPEEISILKFFQFLNQLSLFVVPVIALVLFIKKDKPDFICLQKAPNTNQFVAIILLYIASIPLIQYSMQLNSQMQLPESMQALQDWMRNKEDLAANLTNKFMETSEISSYFVNLLVMAVMPAIGEELIFRGLLTRWIGKLTQNIHVNILITSFIFSAFHMQFFGFVPRFLLGMILGYTYYYTQSIWSSILLHFINNGVTVTIFFYVFKNNIDVKPEEVGTTDNLYLVIISAIAIVGIIKWLKRQKPKEICLE